MARCLCWLAALPSGNGLIIIAVTPDILAIVLEDDWQWFRANYYLLTDAVHIATSWFTGDQDIDTSNMLAHLAFTLKIRLSSH